MTPVSITDYDDTGEWFLLVSDDLWDYELYEKLCQHWYPIVGANVYSFALIHCMERDDAGVWLHFLSSPEARQDYACRYHQIPSWS